MLHIDSSRGTVFKNNAVNTMLSVSIYKGGLRITDINALKIEYGETNCYHGNYSDIERQKRENHILRQ